MGAAKCVYIQTTTELTSCTAPSFNMLLCSYKYWRKILWRAKCDKSVLARYCVRMGAHCRKKMSRAKGETIMLKGKY